MTPTAKPKRPAKPRTKAKAAEAKRAGRGRPKSKNPRSEFIGVRMTPKDFRKFKAAAKKAKASLSSTVLAAALAGLGG